MLILIFIIAGLVKGVTGMGLPTVAMGLMGSIMSPVAAAALLLMPSAVTNIWQMFGSRHIRQLVQRLWPMMLGIIIATIPATALLTADTAWTGMALGVVLIVYACGAWLAPAWTVPGRHEFWLTPMAGVVTGVITGITGVFVIPAVPYLQALKLDKEQLVQALGLSFTVSTLALTAGLAINDALKTEQFSMSLLYVLPALAGMWLGQLIRKRISQQRFRQCFFLLLVVIGVQLLLKPFF